MPAAPDEVAAVVRASVADLAPRGAPVRPDLRLSDDLGYDSVALLELMTALEARFGLAPVTGDRLITVATVGDVERLVAALLAASETGT